MDDPTFQGLLAAWAVTPDNTALCQVVLDACVARADTASAERVLQAQEIDALDPERRRALAGLFLSQRLPERALELAPESAHVLRARSFLLLGRESQALAAWRLALQDDPGLTDERLDRLLDTAHLDREGKPKLRVLHTVEAAPAEAMVEPQREVVTFADVGGLDEVKKRIHKKIILPQQRPGLFARFKRKAGGGVLLYGPPGCGKTLLARATAGETGATFLDVRISDVLDMWFGESEAKLAALFEKARVDAPSVLFFDEVEALGGKRQHTRSDTAAKLVSQFLAEMDGFSTNNEGVLILAATNVPWAVDPAFRRPGRFDRVLFVPPPDREARRAILRLHLQGRPLAPDLELDVLARKTSGYSGADLEEVVGTAADLAIEACLERGEDVPIRQAMLLEALEDVRPTTTEWLTTARNYARYANEAGQYDEVLDFLKRHGKS